MGLLDTVQQLWSALDDAWQRMRRISSSMGLQCTQPTQLYELRNLGPECMMVAEIQVQIKAAGALSATPGPPSFAGSAREQIEALQQMWQPQSDAIYQPQVAASSNWQM